MHIFRGCQTQSERLIPVCDVCVTFVGINSFFRYCCCILICIACTHLGQLPYCSFRKSRTFVLSCSNQGPLNNWTEHSAVSEMTM